MALCFAAFAGPVRADTRAEIDSLLSFVGSQQGTEFLRNGAAHTAAEAENHLRRKWRRGGDRIKTAEDFIRYCATRSSFTGARYRVRYADGSLRDADEVLHEELRRIRGGRTN